MANNPPTSDTIRLTPAEDAPRVGHPTQPLEIEEPGVAEEDINFPTGTKLWLTVASLCVALFLKGLVCSLLVDSVGYLGIDIVLGSHYCRSRST